MCQSAFAIVGFLAASIPAYSFAGSIVDQVDCLRGRSGVAYDASDALSRIDARVVACFNYEEVKRADDYRRLAKSLDILSLRVRDLEGEIERLKAAKP